MRSPRRTIYRIIEVTERTWSTEGDAGSGPPASKLPDAARKRMAKAASNKVGITARKLCRKYVSPLHLSPKYSRRRGWSATRVRKVRRAVPSLCVDRRSAAEQWSEITASPHHKTELVLRKDIPQNVPQLAWLKICGLHLRRLCTVVAASGRPKTRSSWREERDSVRELDWDVVRTMMAKVKTRLRNAVDKSPLSLLKFHLNTPGAI